MMLTSANINVRTRPQPKAPQATLGRTESAARAVLTAMVDGQSISVTEADALLSVFADFDGLLNSLFKIEVLKGKIRQALTAEYARKRAIVNELAPVITERHLTDAKDHIARMVVGLLPYKSLGANASILKSIVSSLSQTYLSVSCKMSARIHSHCTVH